MKIFVDFGKIISNAFEFQLKLYMVFFEPLINVHSVRCNFLAIFFAMKSIFLNKPFMMVEAVKKLNKVSLQLVLRYTNDVDEMQLAGFDESASF